MDRWVRKENPDGMESQEVLDHQVHRANGVLLVCLVFLDQRATEDSLDWTELREMWVVLVKRERMVLLGLLVLQALRVLEVLGVREEETDPLDLQGSEG